MVKFSLCEDNDVFCELKGSTSSTIFCWDHKVDIELKWMACKVLTVEKTKHLVISNLNLLQL
jgi:hypothetical protein